MCSVCGCTVYTPSIFWNSFQETEITTISHTMWAATSSNSSATAKVKMKMKMLPAGFPVALRNTAIQVCDRLCDRSFLLLWIVDLVVDAVDVVDVSVSEFVLFPPDERLAIFKRCFVAPTNSCRCRRGFWNPSAFKRRTQCLAFCCRSARVAV